MDFEVDSEVAEALTGFLKDDDPSLHSIDTLFQNNFTGYILQQPPMPFEQQPQQFFEPNVYPPMAGCIAPPSLSDLNSSGDRGVNLGGMDHFEVNLEVADALIGFLKDDDDPSLHFVDILFQNDFMTGYIRQQPPPLLEQQPPPQLFEPNVYPTMAPPGCSLSAQSVAARKRRKRISEKTQELARHIPGGIKLNTADMFQYAYKYIKFLEAQLAVLQPTASTLECGRAKEEEYLYVLLASPAMQERLTIQEMCIVPLYETP